MHHRFGWPQPKGRSIQRRAVELAGDAQRLRDAPRTSTSTPINARATSSDEAPNSTPAIQLMGQA